MSEAVQYVARRLREFRIQRGYTQEELAERAGLHNTYIGQVERGEKNITIGSLEKILRALDVAFPDLFNGLSQRSSDSDKDYPMLCYKLLLSKDANAQRLLYDILSSIDSLTG